MADRSDTIDELKVKLGMLIKSYKDQEKIVEVAHTLKEENTILKKQYEDLKTAGSLKFSKNDMKQTKLYISRLIREIDKCIAMLSA